MKICLNLTVLEIYAKKLPFDSYVLFLVMAALFHDKLKIPTTVLFRIPKGTFVVSEKSL